MPRRVIEVALRVTTVDESVAASVAEILSRVLVSVTDGPVRAVVEVERYEHQCDHEHDEGEVGPP